MIRWAACVAGALLVGAPVYAGELDTEFGAKKVVTVRSDASVAPAKTAAVPAVAKTSELDSESPTDAGRHGGGHGWHGKRLLELLEFRVVIGHSREGQLTGEGVLELPGQREPLLGRSGREITE